MKEKKIIREIKKPRRRILIRRPSIEEEIIHAEKLNVDNVLKRQKEEKEEHEKEEHEKEEKEKSLEELADESPQEPEFPEAQEQREPEINPREVYASSQEQESKYLISGQQENRQGNQANRTYSAQNNEDDPQNRTYNRPHERKDSTRRRYRTSRDDT